MNQLPHSIEAEQCVLSLCFMGSADIICQELDQSDFYTESHQKIFAAIKSLHSAKEPVEIINATMLLRQNKALKSVGGAAYISKLIDSIPAPEHALNYCSVIKDKSIKRRLIFQHNEIIKACYDDKPTDQIAIEQRKVFNIELPAERDQVLRQVEDWVKAAPGEFSLVDLDRDLKITDPWQKVLRTSACEKLLKEGILERSGNRRGWYRPCESELKCQDFMGCEDRPVQLWLPFNLNEKVDIFERNIITIGGEKNAGKTTLLLNIAWCNRDRYQVHYFNSEMGDQELKRRIMKSEVPDLREWSKIQFYERARNFSDVIQSGANDLNVIDFLELSDEFWKVGQLVRDIHDKMGESISVIAVQKKTGADNPRGGEFIKEKSRLHLDLSNDPDSEYRHKLKINPGKNWHTDKNPNGHYVRFKIVQGNRLIPLADHANDIVWFEHENKTQTVKTI